jgi:hypothetical protein
MAILVDENPRVICRDFAGRKGTFRSEEAVAFGTRMAGGRPGARCGRVSAPEAYRQRGLLSLGWKACEPARRHAIMNRGTL